MLVQTNSTTVVEKRLAWHPRHLNRFIVAGNSQITLYECAPGQPEIRHITSQNDLNLMKCFTWSPEPLFDDLLAVGHSNGRVDLIRLESSRYTGADNILSAGPVVSLPVKNQRACNTLAFSGKDPNYLAVGLDKVRGDASLIIWDVNSALPILSFGGATSNSSTSNGVDVSNQILRTRSSPAIPRTEHGTKFDNRMLQVHATTDYVSSLAFLPDSSHLLLAGISSRWLRLFDLRARPSSSNNNTNLQNGTGGGPVANVASKVQGVVTDPFDPHRVASWGDGVVTVWDARNLGGGSLLTFTERDGAADGGIFPSAQLTTSASTTSLASLPRKGTGLISGSAPERVTSPYISIEFSANRRGQLATLSKDAPYVRLWDILEASVPSAWSTFSQTDVLSRVTNSDLVSGNTSTRDRGRSLRDRENSTGSTISDGRKQTLSLPKRSWPNFPSWGGRASLPSVEREISKDSSVIATSLVLSDTRKTNPLLPITGPEHYPSQPRTLTSFALVPSPSFYNRQQPSTSTKIVMITSAGELALQTLHDSPKAEAAWSAKGHIGGIGFAHNESQAPSNEQWNEYAGSPSPSTDKSKSKSQSQSKLESYDDYPHGWSRADAHPRNFDGAEPSKASQRSKEVLSSESHAPLTVERGRRQTKPTREPGGTRLDPIYTLLADDDISSVMRRRARKGYGFGNASQNATLVYDQGNAIQSQNLSTLWTWIHHTQTHLHAPTPHVQGYDFTYQGVWRIWNGLTDNQDLLSSNKATAGTDSPMEESISADATPVHRNNVELPPLLLEGSLLGEPLAKRSGKHSSKWKRRHVSSTSTPSPIPTPPNRENTWHAALKEIAARFSSLGSQTTIRVATSKMLQRQVCLGLLGWENEALVGFDSRSVRSGTSQPASRDELSRIACWLVFFGQWEKAVEMLIGSSDETHHMMSATIAALAPSAFPAQSTINTVQPYPSPLNAHYSRLRARVQDPYLWAILTYLTTRDVSPILGIGEDGEPKRKLNIAFRERLALAFIFLDDWSLSSYLRRCNQMAKNPEQMDDDIGLDLIAVTGLASPEGREVLGWWVDRTADVQSAALLGWMGLTCNIHFFQPNNAKTEKGKAARARREDKKRVERWVEIYRDLLDSWQMFHERVEFDINRGEIGRRVMANKGSVGKVEWPTIPRQIVIRCNYCNKPVTPVPNMQGEIPPRKGKPTVCPNCSRGLPRCSVCLLVLSIVQDPVRNAQLVARDSVNQSDTVDEAIVICQTCRHGGHVSHISGWFFGNDGEGPGHHVCPVADCDCRCADHF
ncbi:hypothetical protein E1B28_000449 [Marasmius oreades]|uniref:GATOR2 complex protein MIO zinc-ribbon like domain-containing protein n=1 Tax=Marasmius oreades TaxID=181124 RepID=A0A9P8AEL4_9AGAR|nr:uncharacterized protein E1B28_000449 [Marasmius oreades]KAG7098505.1 hypothetical protein E1B28_000449 [Marasmius oreades]